MLARPFNARIKPRARQSGVVLMIALIVLVAMTLAGIALVRSVDTTNVIAGNLAFQQTAAHSGDTGIETAITCLTAANTLNPSNLYSDYGACGYHAARLDPDSGESWDDFWARAGANMPLTTDAGGNTVSYLIHRLCELGGLPPQSANCSFTPSDCDPDGSHVGGKSFCGKDTQQVYYRITSRIVGPRNTVSFVQAIIAM